MTDVLGPRKVRVGEGEDRFEGEDRGEWVERSVLEKQRERRLKKRMEGGKGGEERIEEKR